MSKVDVVVGVKTDEFPSDNGQYFLTEYSFSGLTTEQKQLMEELATNTKTGATFYKEDNGIVRHNQFKDYGDTVKFELGVNEKTGKAFLKSTVRASKEDKQLGKLNVQAGKFANLKDGINQAASVIIVENSRPAIAPAPQAVRNNSKPKAEEGDKKTEEAPKVDETADLTKP